MAKSLDPSSLTEDTPPPDISERLARGAILEALRTTYMPPIIRPPGAMWSPRVSSASRPLSRALLYAGRPQATSCERGRRPSPPTRVRVAGGVLEIGPHDPCQRVPSGTW